MRAPAEVVLRIFHAVLVCCRIRVEGPRDWPSMRRFLIKHSAEELQARMEKLLQGYWDLPNAGDAVLRRLFSGPQGIDPWAIASLPRVVVIAAVTLHAVHTLRDAHLESVGMQREVRAQRAWIARCAAVAPVYFGPGRPRPAVRPVDAPAVENGRSAWAPAPAAAAAAWTAAWGWRAAAPAAPAPQAPAPQAPPTAPGHSGLRAAGRPAGRPCRAPAAAWVPSEADMRAALAFRSAALAPRTGKEKEKDVRDDDPESTCSGHPSTQEPRYSDDESSEISFCLSDSMTLDL